MSAIMVESSPPLILNISSDEDEDVFGGDGDPNYDWTAELFRDDEMDNDPDDVAVLSGFVINPEIEKKGQCVDDDVDDDCVVLEDDPDKPGEVEGVCGSDDLMIVGEKGKVACRDYPHARHLCAKFLFASTPHKQHCQQCHCYVCDLVAPCVYWGTGSSNTDHCHSTDQDPFWKAQREAFKQGNKTPLPNPQIPITPLVPPLPPPPPPPPPTTIQAPVLMQNQNQLARLTAIRACTTPITSGNQILVHQSCPAHTFSLSRKKFNPLLVSQQLLSSCNNSNQNGGIQSNSKLRAQFLNRLKMFKKQGSNGVSRPATIQSGYGSISNNYALQYSRNTNPFPDMRNINITHQQPAFTRTHPYYNSGSTGSVPLPQTRVPSQMNSGSSFVGSIPSQPVAFNNQLNNGNGSENSVSTQFRPNMSSTILNPFSLQGNSQLYGFQNQVPFQSQLFHQPNIGGCFSLPLSQSYSQPNLAISNFENQTLSQLNYLQKGNESQSAINQSPANFHSSGVGPTDQYNKTDDISAQNPTLPQYDLSVIPEKTDPLSYFCEPDPWMEGYVGSDGFDLCPPIAVAVDTVDTINTGPLFDYTDPVFQ